MHIEFDVNKNDTNIRDRSLAFGRATDFDFDSAIIKRDVRKTYHEVRYVTVVFLDARLHVLCFTPIDGGIRVISFRKANQREVRDYEQTYPTH